MSSHAPRWLSLGLAGALAGCATNGPRVLPKAQFHYNEAVADSLNEELLLNVVRLHYRDTPVFLELNQIVAGYQFETEGSVGFDLQPDTGRVLDDGDVSVGGTLTERPTVTFSPLRGEAFTKRLLSPIAPETLLLLTASGWQVERVMMCCVHDLNGLKNLPATPDAGFSIPKTFGDFREVARELEALQQSDNLAIRLGIDEEGRTSVLFEGEGGERVRERIGLRGVEGPIPLTPTFGRRKQGEVSITGRSVLGVMTFLSRYVEAPKAHQQAGWVSACSGHTRDLAGGLFNVRSGASPPEGSFVSVRYRDHWFWIENSDLDSKETFGLLTQLLSLQASGSDKGSPILTLPAG